MTVKEAKSQYKKLLKKARPKLSDATMTVYTNNIFRVAKMKGLDTIPLTAGWLDNEALRKKVQKIETKIRRHLLTAVVVGLDAYGKERTGKWGQMLAKTSEEYQKQRNKRTVL